MNLEDISPEQTRNFSIIAHVDHGKTTLSDRLLTITGALAEREIVEQTLDSMDLERERGITIKSHPVTMRYKARNGEFYKLNLLDTPGHVDFSYEVSRSLAACEACLLLVDAAQGVEAQTVANAHLAHQQNLLIIPIINKIDLPGADVPRIKKQLEDILAIPAEETIEASGKTGIGVEEILEAIVERTPPPTNIYKDDKLRALVFDSFFDNYRGVVSYCRVFSGSLNSGMKIKLLGANKNYEIKECGIFTPNQTKTAKLIKGDVGYIIANVKSVADAKIGDTIANAKEQDTDALPGFREIRPAVFAGIYPISSDDFEALKIAVGKLGLNDAAFSYTAESSAALGFGFRCGFLGLLHMEIILERLRREYDMDVISTYPGVVYEVESTDGSITLIENPTHWPETQNIASVKEPYIRLFILTPNERIGDIINLLLEKRGELQNTETIDSERVMLTAEAPLAEILIDFNDKLKSVTSGYGSMDYENAGSKPSKLVKLDILISGERVDAFSTIVHPDKAQARGRSIVARLKEVIPKQLFQVAIQAAIGGKIIARETITAMRKNVTAKCYGGDISRKRKLLEKQKEGKKRMKSIGKVNVPQEAFVQVLRSGK